MGIFRLLVIGALAYLAYGAIRKVLALGEAHKPDNLKKQDDEVIEICPDCGQVKGKNHKC